MQTVESIHECSYVRRLSTVKSLIGGTPLYRLQNVIDKPRVEIYAKLEWYQLGGSVKSRPAFNIIRTAIDSGELQEGKALLDATSGNTGIAYAAIGAALGIPVTLCLPENASEERKSILRSLGAEIIFTSRFDSTDGAQEKARSLSLAYPDRYFYADQYSNHANWQAHFQSTAKEIWQQTRGQVTHFVAGLGTTGTFTGTGRGLRALHPEISLIALQPDIPMHGMEGWKHLETAKVPAIFQSNLPDEVLEIDTEEALKWVKILSQREGLLVSPSAAANLAGAIRVTESIDQGVIVTTFADNADKYTDILQRL